MANLALFSKYGLKDESLNSKCTVSIKRPGLNFLKKILLNDQYYLKNQRSKQ